MADLTMRYPQVTVRPPFVRCAACLGNAASMALRWAGVSKQERIALRLALHGKSYAEAIMELKNWVTVRD